MQTKPLANQVAIVTGASRGIGAAIALRYAAAGARFVVSARTTDEQPHYLGGTIGATVQAVAEQGGEALAVQADLALAADRERLIATAVEHFGRVDVLVNNAAITYFMPVADFTDKRFRLMLEVQVRAPFELAQLVLPHMRNQGGGWILNVSSHAALHPAKDAGGRGGTVYGMCKAALERFTTGLASELYEEGIGVNVISPGLIATPGTVHHKLINDESREREVAMSTMTEACLHLVHGDPKQLTGRVDYATDVVAEFGLTPMELPWPT